LNVSGMTIAGLPAIIIGRTPHHAWSMQVGHAHTVDYYMESAAAMTLNRTETIKVKGGADVVLPIYRTAHGSVVNASPVISWKYSQWGYEFKVIKAYLGLARATSMDEFGAAIELVPLSQHFTYADRDGNIAYWMSGRDPVVLPVNGGCHRAPQAHPWNGTQQTLSPAQQIAIPARVITVDGTTRRMQVTPIHPIISHIP